MVNQTKILAAALVIPFLTGCAHQRDVSLVKDRIEKLQPLSTYTSTVCEIEARPTEPARARFQQMNPKEFKQIPEDGWTFKWRQLESRCEISAKADLAKNPIIKTELGLIEAAFCVLNQVFFVNSPFDELKAGPEDVKRDGNFIKLGELYLDPGDFVIRTQSTSRGEFTARYRQEDGEWLPDRMEHKPENMDILLDQFEYGERVGRRRTIKSVMLSVGTERPLAHSQLIVRNCQRL